MGVFICWSGENSRSKKIAEILRERIPEILQTAVPFLSAVDVGAGRVWMDELKTALKDNSFGILCITPENKDNPWIHFEAGALWRTEEDRRVCPLLFDIRPAEITGPLSQLQCKQLDQHDFFEVMKEVNQFGSSAKIDESVLKKAFARVWPDIETDISKVKKPLDLVKQPRDPNEMTEEILTIVRSLQQTDRTEILTRIELSFVPISSRCFWHMGKQGDQPVMQIVTHWNVTNLPTSTMPARLLEAILLEPQGEIIASIVHPARTSPREPYLEEIREGEMSKFAISFFVKPVTEPTSETLEVKIVVVDQLAKHALPPITLKRMG